MLSPRRDDLALLLGLVMGVAVLGAFGFAAHRERLAAANDFSTMWTGARAVLDGKDPYDRAEWPSVMAAYGTQRSHEDFFGYPPWVTLALLPFGALPIGPAGLAWAATGVTVGALGLRALLRAVIPGLPVVDTLAGLTLLASQPGIGTFWDGQWGLLLAGAVALGCAGIVSRRAPLLIGPVAMLAKPHLFVFAAWAFVDSLVVRRQGRALAILLGATGLAVAAGSLLLPGWYQDWLGPAFFGRVAAGRQPTTVPAALEDLIGPAGLWIGVLAIGCGIALALAFDRRSDAALAVWLALSSAAAVYSWSYDHVLLVVPVVMATGVIARRARERAIAFAALAFTFLLLVPTLLYAVADARQDESFNAVVPVAIFVACALALWPDRRVRTPGGP